ncbi:MAG: MoaD family protein [Candidatus Bathyarchaeia archaeon]
MLIKVHFLFNLRSIVGEKEVILRLENNVTTIRDLIRLLIGKYGEKLEKVLRGESEEFNSSITILVNGRNVVFIKGLETTLSDGDIISIIPPAGGG